MRCKKKDEAEKNKEKGYQAITLKMLSGIHGGALKRFNFSASYIDCKP